MSIVHAEALIPAPLLAALFQPADASDSANQKIVEEFLIGLGRSVHASRLTNSINGLSGDGALPPVGECAEQD